MVLVNTCYAFVNGLLGTSHSRLAMSGNGDVGSTGSSMDLTSFVTTGTLDFFFFGQCRLSGRLSSDVTEPLARLPLGCCEFLLWQCSVLKDATWFSLDLGRFLDVMESPTEVGMVLVSWNAVLIGNG